MPDSFSIRDLRDVLGGKDFFQDLHPRLRILMQHAMTEGPCVIRRDMTTEQLKDLQAPLKEKYRAQPETAMITLSSEGKIGEGISCKVQTGTALVEAGLHPATGGDGSLACSGDLLLDALVACAGVTLRAVSTAIGVEIRDGVIKAEGDLDFRGTLGVSKEAPVGFRAIRLSFDLETEATVEQLQTLAKLTERYCVVYQTLLRGVNVETSFGAR